MESVIVDENTVFINGYYYKAVLVDTREKCELCDCYGDLNMCLSAPCCSDTYRSDHRNVIFVKGA